ncbi:MAG: exodeoxyribonuclease III [Planctomycetes bacterium GWF2_42_9]|nr:MAG: exodeoxyribonuclease III [Planctomycetes bacterium GWF2_42_9]
MKIVTFNVNSIRSRTQILLDWLQENKPDVLCLQETKVQDKDFPAEAFAFSGYDFVYKGEKSYNGVAIFSLKKLEAVEFGLDSDPKDEARMVKAQLGNLIIINTYIPQGFFVESDKYVYKLNWYKRLLEYFKKNFKPGDKILWMGDLNIAYEPKDVHDPVRLEGHVCFNKELSQLFKQFIDWGFVDLFRKFCSDEGQYSFWDYRDVNTLKRNRGWRLDYIMATKPMADVCKKCLIDKKPRMLDKPSDHTPVIAEFDNF